MSARLGIGTASLLAGYGLQAAPIDGDALLRHAIERGIDYIDTAAAYGDSERTIGGLADVIRARGITIATKLTAAALLADGIAPTLDRLRQPSVDTLLLHTAPHADITAAGAGERLQEVRATGAAARVGVSTYGSERARIALEQPWCDAVQVEFSVLNPSVVRAVSGVRRPGQQLIARSVFCKGLLTPRAASAPVPPTARETIDALTATAAAWGMTLPQLALRFALDTPGIDVVVIGVSSPAEIDAALAVRDRAPFGAAELATLAAFDRSEETWTHPETWTA